MITVTVRGRNKSDLLAVLDQLRFVIENLAERETTLVVTSGEEADRVEDTSSSTDGPRPQSTIPA